VFCESTSEREAYIAESDDGDRGKIFDLCHYG
jgi:hypothetical protein